MADATALLAVPVDDGAIQRAFETLDAQMDAWLAAMRRAEQAVAASLEIRSSVPAGPAASTETLRPFASAGAASDAERPEDAEPPKAASQTRSADPVRIAETPAPVEAKPVPLPASAAEEPLPAVVPVPVAQQVPAAAASPAKRVSEDEAILATLDEETAKAIRVMRRMCMNTKSVKELLAEYQAKKEDQSAATASKKSWFRRGR